MTGGTLFSGIQAPEQAMPEIEWKWRAEIEPFPAAVGDVRHAGVPNLGDVTKITADMVEPVDLVVFGSPCFPAGTLVLCRRGLIPIECVTTDDEVLTHEGRYRRVLKTGGAVADTVSVKGQGHWSLETTPEHPIYSRASKRVYSKRDKQGKQYTWREFSEPEWTPAAKMQGRFWAQPAWFPVEAMPDFEVRGRERDVPIFSEAFFWMLGAFAGNGWTRSNQRGNRPDGQENGGIIICTGYHKADELQRHLSATGLKWCRSEEQTGVKFRMTSLPLRRWLDEHFGKYAHGKTIPAWMLGQPQTLRESFLEGYLFTDGSTDARGDYGFTTVSRKLAVGIKLLLHSLGYSVTVSYHEPNRIAVIEGRVVNERPQYTVKANLHPRSSVQLGMHRYGCVRTVIACRQSVQVFNLEVEHDNSYTADGVVVHNCQDLSVAGKRAGLNGERSGLFFTAIDIIRWSGARFALWENVPGAFSSNAGRDFAAVVGALTGVEPDVPDGGWRNTGVALGPLGLLEWCVLDAQWFGVPQRRRRIFALADFGGWPSRSPILLEPYGLQGHPPPRREAREAVTGCLSARTQGGGGLGTDFDCQGGARP
jgi:hypothetical protein